MIEVNQMEGITDPMRQYERATEELWKGKSKNGRAYGIKRPEAMNIVAVLSGLFVLSVIFAEFM
jgi:hypothetical protein